MSKALTVYDVTYGEGSVWTQNDENKGLRFIVNGYHAKFQDIVINGAVADKKHYQGEIGSIVITLKDEYLQTLDAGKYTLVIRYTDGSTDGTDTFTIAKNKPDTSFDVGKHIILISLSIACVGLLVAILLFFKRRKQNQKIGIKSKNGVRSE